MEGGLGGDDITAARASWLSLIWSRVVIRILEGILYDRRSGIGRTASAHSHCGRRQEVDDDDTVDAASSIIGTSVIVRLWHCGQAGHPLPVLHLRLPGWTCASTSWVGAWRRSRALRCQAAPAPWSGPGN